MEDAASDRAVRSGGEGVLVAETPHEHTLGYGRGRQRRLGQIAPARERDGQTRILPHGQGGRGQGGRQLQASDQPRIGKPVRGRRQRADFGGQGRPGHREGGRGPGQAGEPGLGRPQG